MANGWRCSLLGYSSRACDEAAGEILTHISPSPFNILSHRLAMIAMPGKKQLIN
jgi:hypothetical protein